ncbi:MAG TPA: hypothetical protein VNI20_00820 [Fimbriimonadaceae bacterium]|nr:hypothetical protein [Fimbriimonadaceae bacterium]
MNKICVALVLCSALLAGCAKPEAKFVGKWDGKATFPQKVIDLLKAMVPADQQDKIEEDLTSGSISLELKKDMTYALVTSSKDRTDTTNGTWTLDKDGKNITLSAPKVTDADRKEGKAMGATDDMIDAGNKPLVCSIGEGGKTMTYSETQAGFTVSVTFTKK